MLSKLAEQQLRKAGWYPGRKVDISDQIAFWEEMEYPTFDAGLRFVEEFGKLHIYDKYTFKLTNTFHIQYMTTYITEILKPGTFSGNLAKLEGTIFLPIFNDSGMFDAFITEKGTFYGFAPQFPDSFIGNNSDEFWNNIYKDQEKYNDYL